MSAVVVSRKGEVLSVGYNRKRPTRRGHTSVHAEIDAIKKAGWANLKNATLYITRYGNKDCSGVSRLARPCSHCAAVLEKALWEYGVNGTTILGETWGKTITRYLNEYPIDWNTPAAGDSAIDAKTCQQWALLGDPSLQIGGYPS